MPHLYVALDKTISLVNEHKWGTYLSSLLTFIPYLLFIPILSLFLSSQRTGLMVESLPLSLSLLQGPLHLNTSKHYSSPHLFIHMLSPHRVFFIFMNEHTSGMRGNRGNSSICHDMRGPAPWPPEALSQMGLNPRSTFTSVKGHRGNSPAILSMLWCKAFTPIKWEGSFHPSLIHFQSHPHLLHTILKAFLEGMGKH